jgi:hypothetical protein
MSGSPTVATPLSGPAGEAVCAEAGRQHDPAVSRHIVWVDERLGPAAAAIRGRQLVGALGQLAPSWLVLAPASGAQAGPSSDHYQGMCATEACPAHDVVAWTDSRDPATAPDVYAQALGVDVEYVVVGVPGAPTDAGTTLSLARPTPSRSSVSLTLTLADAGEVSLGVYDVAGRLVRTLLHGALPAGRHVATWDGRGRDGESCPPGLYFVRGHGGRQALERRIVRLAP